MLVICKSAGKFCHKTLSSRNSSNLNLDVKLDSTNFETGVKCVIL